MCAIHRLELVDPVTSLDFPLGFAVIFRLKFVSRRPCSGPLVDPIRFSLCYHGLELVNLVQKDLGVVRAVVLHDLGRVAPVDGVDVLLQLAPYRLVQLLRVCTVTCSSLLSLIWCAHEQFLWNCLVYYVVFHAVP